MSQNESSKFKIVVKSNPFSEFRLTREQVHLISNLFLKTEVTPSFSRLAVFDEWRERTLLGVPIWVHMTYWPEFMEVMDKGLRHESLRMTTEEYAFLLRFQSTVRRACELSTQLAVDFETTG